jgi:hypothetical protein
LQDPLFENPLAFLRKKKKVRGGKERQRKRKGEERGGKGRKERGNVRETVRSELRG